MKVWLRSWWQKIKQHRVAIEVIGIVLVVVIALIIAGYWFDWTGFNGYTKVITAHIISGPSTGTFTRTEEYQPGKALWDWLQLLIIPAVLAVGGYLFNFTNSRTERDIAADNQRETALKEYFDQLSDLLLKEHLGEFKPEYENVRKIARVRTLTVLRRLDENRKRSVLQFLYESGLIFKDECIIDLRDANLRGVNLKGIDLRKINLSGTDLTNAILFNTGMKEANLSHANLTGANLDRADLNYADVTNANLFGAHLQGAKLLHANLREVNLAKANLFYAYLTYADLNYAELSYANLSKAHVTPEQLATAKSLQGAIMPDGNVRP